MSYVSSGALQGGTGTWTSQALGDAAADRHIIVGYYGLIQASAPTCTVGGVTATLVNSYSDGSVTIAMYIAAVPTGTTGDIVFNPAPANRHNWVAWRTTGLTSATATASAVDTTLSGSDMSTTFAVSAGGIVVGHAATNLSSVTDIGWTNVTEDIYVTATNTRGGGGSTTSTSGSGSFTTTATFTGTTNAPLLIAATWV